MASLNFHWFVSESVADVTFWESCLWGSLLCLEEEPLVLFNYRSSVVLGADGERVLKVQWFVYRISFNFAVLISFPAFAWLFLDPQTPRFNLSWEQTLALLPEVWQLDCAWWWTEPRGPNTVFRWSVFLLLSSSFFWCALLVTWHLIVWDMSEVFVIRISFFLVVTTHLSIFPIASLILRAFLYFNISPKWNYKREKRCIFGANSSSWNTISKLYFKALG